MHFHAMNCLIKLVFFQLGGIITCDATKVLQSSFDFRAVYCTTTQNRIAKFSMLILRISPIIQLRSLAIK